MRLNFLFFLLIPMLMLSQKKIEKTDSISIYIQASNYNLKTHNYKNALTFCQKAIDYAENNNNNKAKSEAMSIMGNIYFKLKKYDDAIKILDKSISYFNLDNPTPKYANTYYLAGLCYIEKENSTKAEKYFNTADSIYKVIKIPEAKDLLNLQKAIVYVSKGEYNLAKPIFEKINSIADIDDIYNIKAEALYNLGYIEAKNNNNSLALNYYNRALQLNNKNGSLELKSKILLALSDVNKKMANISNAYDFLKKHNQLNDSITLLNNENLSPDDYEKFKQSERLKEIGQIDRDIKSELKAKSFSKLINIMAIALISILSLLCLSLYKNNIIRTKSNTLLKDKNKELEIAKDNAERATRTRSEFLSTVSHELRTPLNAINGITHLLIEDKPKENQVEYLNSLKFSGNYLLTFINDILEINRIESKNIPIEKLNFDLKLLLSNIQNSLKEIAQENNNSFVLEIDESIPKNLIGDTTKLSQIFMNLINNSLKFTKSGFVKVHAKINSVEDKNIVVTFKVSDNGIGIPEDKQNTIFDSFSQGSIEINRKYGGTGLGLAIVKSLIELLGGSITLNSKVGLGSTFSFELPFEIGENVLIQPEIKTYDKTIVANKKILLVEDNKINQMITKKMLENRDMSCVIIDNGEDAVKILKTKHDFDLVLMDVHLPGINGTIATEQIRKFNTKIPIIALTAISLNENRVMLMSYGMSDVVTKPFEPENLYKTIANLLSN